MQTPAARRLDGRGRRSTGGRGSPSKTSRRRTPPSTTTETVNGVRAWRTALAASSPSTASASPTSGPPSPGLLPGSPSTARRHCPTAAGSGGNRPLHLTATRSDAASTAGVCRPPDHRIRSPLSASPRLCNPLLQGRTYPEGFRPTMRRPDGRHAENRGDRGPAGRAAPPSTGWPTQSRRTRGTNAAWPAVSVSCGSAGPRAVPGENLVSGERQPGVLELASRILTRLTETSGSLRRVVARGLRLEGATIAAIAALFGVSHQRVSALLHRQQPPALGLRAANRPPLVTLGRPGGVGQW